MITKSNI